MATIEERAKAYRKETERDVFKSGMDISTMEFEYAYIKGANDQKQIDIEKACEWLRENSETLDYQGLSSTCEMLFDTADDMIAYFRKAMEE